MKISYNWLQKYFKEKLPEPEVVADGIIFHSFEIEEIEKVGDDTIFDIKILPDRAHDCLSHWGVAKEVSAIFNLKISSSEIWTKALPLESPRQGLGENLQIEVKNNNCRRYMGRVIKGVKVGPSPVWLSEALISIGQKSINNIVDATNYIMFDLGNPIHAFDLDKLASHKIIIDNASNNEKLTLLDGREVELDESTLTIRDEEEALVVAGVKGGKKAEIDNNTTNIVIEVANFEPISTRKTAKKLAIFTDSSKRFENDISPMLAPLAMDKVTDMILEVAGGEAYDVVDKYNGDEEVRTISFTKEYVNNLLGINISKDEINNILDRFEYKYTEKDDIYNVIVSPLRLDLIGPHDMVEEIGRIHGYDKVVPVLPKIDFKIKENNTWAKINFTKNYLANNGYREVMNYTFVDKGDVEIMASASDKNFLRTNLADGINKSFELNKLNAPILGGEEVKIFEVGTVFPDGEEIINVCFKDKKETEEMSLDEFISKHEEYLVQVVPESYEEKLAPVNLVFEPWSIYPFITRDIAVWVKEGESPEKLIDIYKEFGTELLVAEPQLFDLFTKNGRTSFAYRLVFQSYDKTLRDDEINKIMEEINEKIASLGWEVR